MKFELLHSYNSKILTVGDRKCKLQDGQTFKVCTYNTLPSRVQFDLFMNGKVDNEEALIGSWIIDPFKSATFERGTKSTSLFTFKVNDKGVNLNDLIRTDEDNWGLVSARFRNEEELSYNSDDYDNNVIYRGYKTSKSGIVGSGESKQEFGVTNSIKKYGTLDEIYAVRLIETKFVSINVSAPSYSYP